MDLSVALISWNTKDDLAAALRSVKEKAGLPVELVVVDNASSDASAAMVRAEFPEARLIENTENRGFAAAANQAITESTGRYILLLNPDSLLQTPLSQIVAFADSHPDAGAIGGKILNPDGTLQYSCRAFPHPLAAIFRHTLFGRLWPKNPYVRDYLLADWDHNSEREVDWVSGAFLMIRREMIDQIGAFDERFFMYSEDVDLCFRAREAGWKVCYSPKAISTHAIGHSSDQAAVRMTIQFHRSMYRFFMKHYARSYHPVARALLAIGVGARCGLILAARPFHRPKR